MSKYWSRDDMVRYADSIEKPGRLQDLIANCDKILEANLDGDEETATIVADTETSPILYHTLAGLFELRNVEPTITVIPQLDAPNLDPPAAVTEGLSATDTIVNMCTYTITHSSAIEHALQNTDTTYILLADPTEDTLTRGAVTADPEAVDTTTRIVATILQEGEWVTVTSPQGTDVELSIEDRDQAIAPFPLGETPTCPVEETVNGTIVHDSFMMGVGILEDPITWNVEDGRIQQIRGEREARALRQYIEEYGDDNAYWIGEFSVMTNPRARPNGNYVEHKQVAGGVHFALGTGTELGGKYRSSIHLDGVQLEPTVRVDGDRLVERGEFVHPWVTDPETAPDRATSYADPVFD